MDLTGGQIPPKSSILEIRVNQNPFSAEFDRIGYGRIEIITKPGTQKLQGNIAGFGTDSALNTADPLLPYKPSYDLYSYSAEVNGPLTKNSSYFLDLFRIARQAQNIVDAVNPQNTSVNLQEASPNTWGRTQGSARVDFQAGKRNTLTVRDFFWRSAQTGTGVGALNLPSQANNTLNAENTIQVGDTILVNEALVNEVHLQWRHLRNSQSATVPTPTVTVQGAFTDGGNSSGAVQDHQDDFEIQDKSTATVGRHTLRFGAIVQIYRDANSSTSGANGTYMFTNLAEYQAGTPALYTATVIANPLVRATVANGSLYFQDDWKVNPNFVLGLGLRYEGQNWIADHDDWAPRMALAWSPRHTGTAPAKTVVRAGYGWFYNRFTVPTSFNSFAGTPYVIQALHDNLVNQQSYIDRTIRASTIPMRPEPAIVADSRRRRRCPPITPSIRIFTRRSICRAASAWTGRSPSDHGQHHLSLHAGRAPIPVEQRDRARVRSRHLHRDWRGARRCTTTSSSRSGVYRQSQMIITAQRAPQAA